MNLIEPPIIATIAGSAETPADSIDLTGYRHLTYAPSQWGEGVRTANHGTAVAEIAAAVRRIDLVGSIEQIGKELDLTWDELFDALRYARDHGPL